MTKTMTTIKDADDTESIDNFKAIFKKYKRRDTKLDLSDVIDVSQLKVSSCRDNQKVKQVKPAVPSIAPIVGLLPSKQWHIFHFLQHPGFYLIRNPFVAGSQRYWVSRCLQDLPQPPNVTNLRVHPEVDPSTLWAQFEASCHAGKPFDNSSPLRKLRWTTIGYHYDWNTKEYREEAHTPFPTDVGVLAQYVAEVLGFPDLQPEAGIINYYHLDSTLAAHTDHSELDHQAPLISISFGQDAVFLIGGQTKATPPTAVMLHSGDICVMSGTSRLAYHALPRILPSTSPSCPPCFDLTPHDLQLLTHTLSGQGTKDDLLETADLVSHVTEDKTTANRDVCCASKHLGCHVTEDSTANRDMCCERKRLGCHIIEDKITANRDMCCERTEDSGAQGNGKRSRLVSNIQGQRDTNSDSKDLIDNQQHHCGTACGVCVTNTGVSTKGVVHRHNEGHGGNDCCCGGHLTVSDAADPNCPTADVCARAGDSKPFPAQCTHSLSHQPERATQASSEVVRGVNQAIVDTLHTQEWQSFAVYLRYSRLNVNIRQVLQPGQTFPSAVAAASQLVQS